MATESGPLHIEAVTRGEGDPDACIVLLHGVFARGRNLIGIARRLVQHAPGCKVLLPDLPLHGRSAPPATAPPGGWTIARMAKAIAESLEAGGLRPHTIIGHSLGGKVAAHLASQIHRKHGNPSNLWLLDATPCPLPDDGMPWRVLEVLAEHPGPFRTRREAAGQLEQVLPERTATWLAGGLIRRDGRLHWPWNLEAMAALLSDYAADDATPRLPRHRTEGQAHIVKADASPLLDEATLTRLRGLARGGRPLHLHHLPGSHWFHTEHPDALVTLIARGLSTAETEG